MSEKISLDSSEVKHSFLNHIAKIQPPPAPMRNVAERCGKRGRRGEKRGKLYVCP